MNLGLIYSRAAHVLISLALYVLLVELCSLSKNISVFHFFHFLSLAVVSSHLGVKP